MREDQDDAAGKANKQPRLPEGEAGKNNKDAETKEIEKQKDTNAESEVVLKTFVPSAG